MALVHALVIDGGVAESKDVPLLVPRGHVVLKTLWARWGAVDEAVRRGLVPLRGPVVAGYTGVGVVVEIGIGASTSLSGKTVSLIAVSEQYAPPIIGNGFLSTYVSVPANQLEAVAREQSSVLVLDAALACNTAELLDERDAYRVIVAGGGVYAILTALLLHERGVDYSLLTSSNAEAKHAMRELGLSVTQSLPESIDAVVAATTDTLSLEGIVSRYSSLTLVMHPLAAYRGIRVHGIGRRLEAISVTGGRRHAGCATRLVRRAWKNLSSYMGFMNGLVSPPRSNIPLLGLVYRLSS